MLLLTNDDGIDAPGLASLAHAVEGLGAGPTRVVAPSEAWSSLGHAVSRGAPIRIERRGADRIAAGGSPADCVRLALDHLATDASWVLSGINRGGNLGADVHHSGTVAAAREAVLHGRAAIALSHYVRRDRELDWERASRWASLILRWLMARPWEPGTLWNVNLPHLGADEPDPDLVICPLDPSPLPLGYRVDGDGATYSGDYQGRPRVSGCDVAECFGGRVTISKVRILPRDEEVAGGPTEVIPMADVDDRGGPFPAGSG